MDKIAILSSEKGIVDLDNSVTKNIKNLAEYKNTQPDNLTACILDRPRHKKHIEELKALNVKLKLITDGDVSGALLVTDKKYDVDIFLGVGGGPEGVLAASALDAYGCFFQGKFLIETEEDKLRAKKMGIDLYQMEVLCLPGLLGLPAWPACLAWLPGVLALLALLDHH